MERRDTTINGRRYNILVPPVIPSLQLSNRLAVLLAPVISGGLGATTDGKNLMDVGKNLADLVGPALVGLTTALGKVDPLAAHQLMMDAVLATHLTCEDQPVSTSIDFERHFAQNRADAYPVMVWALWECVRDFFPKLEGLPLREMTGAAKAAWQSRMAGQSTGGSDDQSGKGSAHGES